MDLVITEGGAVRVNENYLENPHFAEDDTISEAVVRLRLGIAGLKQPRQDMTFGGM